jgi:hypothetical protein
VVLTGQGRARARRHSWVCSAPEVVRCTTGVTKHALRFPLPDASSTPPFLLRPRYARAQTGMRSTDNFWEVPAPNFQGMLHVEGGSYIRLRPTGAEASWGLMQRDELARKHA